MGNTNGKSTAEKAARGAQIVKGAKKVAGGIASGNYVAVVQGAVEALSPKVILIIICVIVFLLLIPVMLIASIPQMMFSWGQVNDTELIARNVHGTEITQYYAELYDEQPEGVNVDVCWLISIESVLHKQKVEEITRRDVEKSFRRSYITDEETGEVINKTPEEIMNELGFTDEEKNWATLMYSTVSDQYIPPGSDMADNDTEGIGNTEIIGGGSETEVVYYSQIDERWSNTKYGKTGTIGSSGCGPTALAMVVSTLTGNNVTPPMVAKWSAENGHKCEGSGSYHSLIPKGGEHYGLKVTKLGRSSKKELSELLSQGKLIIVIMTKGHFTSGGHFIVLRGITENGKVLVADPVSRKRSNQEWDISIILSEARGDASAGGPFWALSN